MVFLVEDNVKGETQAMKHGEPLLHHEDGKRRAARAYVGFLHIIMYFVFQTS